MQSKESIELMWCPSHMKVEGCTLTMKTTAHAKKEDTPSLGSDYTTIGQVELAPHYNTAASATLPSRHMEYKLAYCSNFNCTLVATSAKILQLIRGDSGF
jgi:hypothetical protein